MPIENSILNLVGYKIEKIEGSYPVRITASYEGVVKCPYCGQKELRKKDRYQRIVRHESIGNRKTELHLTAYKYLCKNCHKYFNQRFPGILRYKRSTEGFRREVFEKHNDGICQSTLSKKLGIGQATVERWYKDFLQNRVIEKINYACPQVLGIDEHFFTKKKGYATTFCDLKNHRIFDIVLGRSEKSLRRYLEKLEGKEKVKVVVMDLSETYRSIARKYFPNAKIVSDRFHVIRLINQHFLGIWKELDPEGRKNRGLLSLMRRHSTNLSQEQRERLDKYLERYPALAQVYVMKQKLCQLLLKKRKTKKECKKLIPKFLSILEMLQSSQMYSLVRLGNTLKSWSEEVVCMWRFTKSNGITEGFHTKMEMISRRAYGFRNFENYKLRVKALCC